jgi:hypothetical protein
VTASLPLQPRKQKRLAVKVIGIRANEVIRPLQLQSGPKE